MTARRGRRSLSLLLAAVISSWACHSDLDNYRTRIADLNKRLGSVKPLHSVEGVKRTSPQKQIPDQKAADSLNRIVAMLSVGEPRKVDLATVRSNTLTGNLGLQASLLDPEVASQELRAERAKFEMTFYTAVRATRTVRPSYYGSELLDVSNDTLSIVPGLKVPLRSGGSFNLDWTFSRDQYDGSEGGGASDEFAVSQPRLSLQQPLLREAGFAYNESSIVLAAANAGVQRGVAQLAVIDQLLAAETGYWNLYFAWKSLEITVEIYKISRQLLNEQRELVKHGTSSIANVYNFEVSLAQSVNRVLDADQRLRLAVRNLKKIMQEPGLSLDGSVSLSPGTDPDLVSYEFDPKRLVVFAMENRAELLKLEYEELERNIEVGMAKNRMLPKLDVRGSYSFNGFDGNGLSFGSASSDLFRGSEDGGWLVGANLSIPIGNEVRQSRYRGALIKRLKAIASTRNREITVAAEVLDAIDVAETRWKQILTTRYEEEAARRFFGAYRVLFDRGEIPSVNLAESLQSLAQAQTDAAHAEVSYQIALARLAKAAGCLLGHAGVEWAPLVDKERLDSPFPSQDSALEDRFENSLDQSGTPLSTLSSGSESYDQFLNEEGEQDKEEPVQPDPEPDR